MTEDRLRYIKEDEITRYVNTHTVRIEINEDKLRLILISFKYSITQRRGWISAGGAPIALLLALVTATFNDAFGISANVWNALFIIALTLYACWFCYSAWRSFRDWKKDVIDDTIRKIRGE